jgi:hypothetical protein
MIRLALILIAIALASSVGQCGEVYVERDASGRPVALVHNGPSTELVNFLKDNADSLQTVETVRLLQHNVDADEIDSLSKLKSLIGRPDWGRRQLSETSSVDWHLHLEQRPFFAIGRVPQRISTAHSQWIGTDKLLGNTLAGVAQVRSFRR